MKYELVFSATGRCAKVAELVSAAFEGTARRVDLSDPTLAAEQLQFGEEDLCIVAVSVFEGRVPAPAVSHLRKLKGNGAKALGLAVFGNRSVDDCLLELSDLLTEQGFVCFAAIEAASQHSLVNQVAADRPDEADRAELRRFAEAAVQRLAQGSFGTLSLPGKRPYVEMGGVPFKPQADERCIGCGVCAAACPTGAIPLEEPSATIPERCITCVRCVALCPTGARRIPEERLERAYQRMKPAFDGRKENRLHLAAQSAEGTV